MGSQLAPRKGGSFSTDRVEALLALLRARLAGGSGPNPAGSPVFVFRPGGTAGGNVYTTQAALRTAMLAVQGPKWLELDVHIAGAIFSGVVDFLQDVTIVGIPYSPGGQPTLFFAAGATISPATNTIHLAGGIVLQNLGGAPVWTPSAAGGIVPVLYAEQNSALFGSATAAFLDIPAGVLMVVNLTDGSIGDSANAAITVAAGGTMVSNSQGGGGFAANAVSGAGTWLSNMTPGATLTEPQGLAPTITYFGPQHITGSNAGGIGPAATVSFTPAGFVARSSSGFVRVSANIEVTGGPASTRITVSILRDGVAVFGFGAYTNAAGAVSKAVAAIDTLPNTLPHTYGVQAVTGVGTLTIPIGGARVDADELT